MSDPERPVVRYEELNALGKVVYWSGAGARLAGTLIDEVVTYAAGIAVEAEEAFRKELDPNMDDATIVSETEEDRH